MEPQPGPKKSHKLRWIGLGALIVILILIIGGIVGYYSYQSTPTRAPIQSQATTVQTATQTATVNIPPIPTQASETSSAQTWKRIAQFHGTGNARYVNTATPDENEGPVNSALFTVSGKQVRLIWKATASHPDALSPISRLSPAFSIDTVSAVSILKRDFTVLVDDDFNQPTKSGVNYVYNLQPGAYYLYVNWANLDSWSIIVEELS